MSKGFIPIRRSLFDHFLFKEKREFSRFEAWLDLIQIATFQDENVQMVKGKAITCTKGQVVASVRYLQDRWGWNSLKKVLGFLELLRSQNMLLIDCEFGVNRITLTNYEKYNVLTVGNTDGNAEWNTKGNSKSRNSKGFQSNRGTQTGTQNDTESETLREQSGNSEETNIKKGNKEKEGEDVGAGAAITYTPSQESSFKNFQAWILDNAPAVAQMKEPFTIEQYLMAAKKYESADIRALLAQMHNWNDLVKKNRSAYLTLMNWKRRENAK
jgi:hypothetical protein